MSRRIHVMAFVKGKDFKEKIMAITRKCLDLAPYYRNFGWEFTTESNELVFSACYRNGDNYGSFSFPLIRVAADRQYEEIMKQLEALMLSAVRYESEVK